MNDIFENRTSNYDRFPYVDVKQRSNNEKINAWQGYEDIVKELSSRLIRMNPEKAIICIDTYPGVYDDEILEAITRGLRPDLVVMAEDANHNNEKIREMLQRNITDDRVFGVLSCHRIEEFFDKNKIAELAAKICDQDKGIVLVYGTGAALICEAAGSADVLVYADMARWEIQLRMRAKRIGNWCADNKEEEFLRKYKRGFFIDWRVNDRHKVGLFGKIDYLLDTNAEGNPKMITGEAFLEGLRQASERPFRLVPFFDPGPWGGQWMKEVCGLDKEKANLAWCFDCVPEENSLLLKYGGITVEVPSIDLVFFKPVELLGDKVHARFGAEFPIRFDFLDTMEGGNLSLQVHPLTEYIQQSFGMHYTQDESYYMLDADEDAVVYLGLKEGINKDEMLTDLKEAQKGTREFDTEKYINKWPAKKHDHFLIPGGTIHCSGKNSMVLEISATPFIFTFKLWDWGRLGLDGKPRPIHLNHGEKVIQWYRDTTWTRDNLVNHITKIAEGDGWTEEKTGLHEREFIETRRHWFTKAVLHNTEGGVNVLNLIEGEEAIIESPAGAFEPFVVHYAETFVIPATVGEYSIRPYGRSEGKRIGTIKAYVRT